MMADSFRNLSEILKNVGGPHPDFLRMMAGSEFQKNYEEFVRAAS
jgi:hypothetical protein